jgi:hypothetical protein
LLAEIEWRDDPLTGVQEDNAGAYRANVGLF